MFTTLLDMLSKVNIMSNINEPFVNDGGRFEVVFVSLASSRYQLRLSILGQFTGLQARSYEVGVGQLLPKQPQTRFLLTDLCHTYT